MGGTSDYDELRPHCDKLVKNRLEFFGQHTTIKSVLEIGAGSGIMRDSFLKMAIKYRGVEINEKLVKTAIEKGSPIELRDFMDFDTSERYDYIFATQVLEHILEPSKFIKKSYDLLSPGGILHIDVPNHNSIASIIRKLKFFSEDYGALQPPYHLIAYSKHSLRYLVESLMLRILFVKSFPNNDSVFGQLMGDDKTPLQRIYFHLCSISGTGGLLVAVIQKKENKMKSRIDVVQELQ